MEIIDKFHCVLLPDGQYKAQVVARRNRDIALLRYCCRRDYNIVLMLIVNYSAKMDTRARLSSFLPVEALALAKTRPKKPAPVIQDL